ncbi:MAG: hypothetical protein KKB50_18485 [Planctomycetes bacterium]|nr:hypothetical protein [Planctomycetota bacterium]
MSRIRGDYRAWVLTITTCLVLTGSAGAQDEPSTRPTTAPADHTAIMTRVIAVHGDVQYASVGARDWQPCQTDDEYPQQTKIRTGLRSSIKLRIGEEEPYTALVIERVGLVVLSEAFKTAESKRVRVGVGYGTIRAGVAEGGLKSDFTVDSPVATLSKRGTWNFGLSYERGTGRFEVFLLDFGLVDALNKVTGQTRGLLPGETVDEVMRRWFAEAAVRRNVAVPDLWGQDSIDVAFNRTGLDGLGILNPGFGRGLVLNVSHASTITPLGQAGRANFVAPVLPSLPRLGPQNLRPEGFFGTGRGGQLVEALVNQNNERKR